MISLDPPTSGSDTLAAHEWLWFIMYGSNDMQWTPEEVLAIILRHGPFPENLLHQWPEDLRKDYLELLSLDLATMGIDEFKRMSRPLGEAYLLSLDNPITSNSILMRSWRAISDVEPPPTPSFTES